MKIWLIVGFIGQALFGARFLIQWVCSEIKKESHIPVVFWYLSLGGGIILFVYAVQIKDPVFIVGQFSGVIVYVRNLILINRKEKKLKAMAN